MGPVETRIEFESTPRLPTALIGQVDISLTWPSSDSENIILTMNISNRLVYLETASQPLDVACCELAQGT